MKNATNKSPSNNYYETTFNKEQFTISNSQGFFVKK